ncbi:ABC transporter permease [Pseudonocardia asaccharolytica]|uniref:Nickel ABC transporter permease subunit NikB n=1 Tax=Pseudonocardia asaccharolytica DSM 44247 = NBRC 16224 TaxID=1123024 RepID=A0A511CZ63_9PSEU|nr:ABC transporter permease [Pseudonocardia asaccharolytica]GEL17553.1 nickel ABC transporter permease subunit NikB [Pseudonocardia asaccharolytica DSM 44247 = NBRC 16224]
MTTVLRRVGQALVTLLGTGLIVFGMLAVTPGDPAHRVLEARGIPEPSPAAVAAVRDELRLDDPLVVRFGRWAGDAVTGDLGVSWRTGRPVADEFVTRLPATLRLTGAAMALAVVLALGLAAVAAAAPGRWPDVVARGVALAMLVVPGFVLGVIVLDVLVVRAGLGRVIADGSWATVFLPALTLALASAASWSRVLRTSLLEAASAPYLRVSVARGAGRRRLLGVHQLPNAAPAFLTMVGLGAAALIGGAPIVESVFTWPGIGRYTVEAINARDMPVVVGFTLVAVVGYVLTSLVVDLVCAALDPRLRTGRAAA